MAFGIYQLYGLLRQDKFRARRTQLFLDTFQPNAATRILDVGGYACNWQEIPITSPITFLNTEYPADWQVTKGRFVSELGDGCRMRFADQSFEIVYSNSVIEHVNSLAEQRKMASEIRRVGRRVFVQTPNRWFFVEPHFLALFVHYLPWPIARKLLRVFSFRGLVRKGDNKDLKQLAEELRFLSFREMQELFPDCRIYKEKWFGLTKSFIAIK
ncbi:MAG: class I SAM-dependent methyltransferase [Verrucomicrobiota bacterium]